MQHDLLISHCRPLVQQWLCGEAASGLERILLKGLWENMDWCTCHRDITENTVENSEKHHTINQS